MADAAGGEAMPAAAGEKGLQVHRLSSLASGHRQGVEQLKCRSHQDRFRSLEAAVAAVAATAAAAASPAVAVVAPVAVAGTIGIADIAAAVEAAAELQCSCLGLDGDKYTLAVGRSERQRWESYRPWEAVCVAIGAMPFKVVQMWHGKSEKWSRVNKVSSEDQNTTCSSTSSGRLANVHR